MGKMPFVGDKFKEAAKKVRGFNDTIQDSVDLAERQTIDAIQSAKRQTGCN